MKYILKPTEEQMKPVADDKNRLYYSIDALLTNPFWAVNGSLFTGTETGPVYWQWSLVETDVGLIVPVPLVKHDNEDGTEFVRLYGAYGPVEMSVEAASLATAYYWLNSILWLRQSREEVLKCQLWRFFLKQTFDWIDENEELLVKAHTELNEAYYDHAEAKAMWKFLD